MFRFRTIVLILSNMMRGIFFNPYAELRLRDARAYAEKQRELARRSVGETSGDGSRKHYQDDVDETGCRHHAVFQ